MANVFCRPLHIAREIVFLDGMNGSGKSILGPILGSFERIEKQALNHIFEHVCLAHHLGRMTSDAAESFLSVYADLQLYNSMISREVNLRFSDDSGILNNPHALRYVSRLFQKDGDDVLERIDRQRTMPQIMTHQMLPLADVLFEKLGKRVKFIEMVRHPVYMLDHWLSYIDRYGTDRREFNFWIEWDGQPLPWFAAGWEKEYTQRSSIDRVIMVIDRLFQRSFEIAAKYGESQIIFVPFESLVLTPDKELSRLENFLQTRRGPATPSVLARQKCPRLRISDGRGHKRYSWKREDDSLTESEILQKKLHQVEAKASSDTVQLLRRLASQYEDRFHVKI